MNRRNIPGLSQPATRAAVAPTVASGFVACPLGLQAAACQWQQLYQWAYEQARAVVQPSRMERYFVPSLN